MEKAIEYLREKGITKAAKKSSRIAAEGLVLAYVSEDNKVGAAVEVNSETDFVAKNEEFRTFVQALAKQVALNNPVDVEALLNEEYIYWDCHEKNREAFPFNTFKYFTNLRNIHSRSN